MSVLPIVERELRVATRKKMTFVIRCGLPILILGLALPVYIYANAYRANAALPAATLSLLVFNGLSICVFIIGLMATLFLVSDCLSEERREGTLGLLFLTDLKGYDVVLGKLMGVGLNTLYGTLAIFPIMSLCLLFGGVTGEEFWRMTVALVNALFFSISAGIWVSARHRHWHRALASTLLVLALFYGLLPFTEIAVTNAGLPIVFGGLFLASPWEPLHFSHDATYGSNPGGYWLSLFLSNLIGWFFLALASRQLPRSLENKPHVQSASRLRMFLQGDKPGAKRQRQNRLLEINPVLWLLEDSPWLRATIWTLAAIGVAAMILVTPLAIKFAGFAPYIVSFPIYFLLKVLFAVQVCRFFSEARRNGWLELMCCTPLSTEQMIQGQWLALKRVFFWPVVLLFLTNVGVATLLIQTRQDGSQYGMIHLVGSALDFIALGWFGMSLALSSKRPGAAAGLTILLVLVLPMLVYCVPNLIFNIFFIATGSAKLAHTFRQLAAGERAPLVAVAKEDTVATIKT